MVLFAPNAFNHPQRYLDNEESASVINKYAEEINDPDTSTILTVSLWSSLHRQ